MARTKKKQTQTDKLKARVKQLEDQLNVVNLELLTARGRLQSASSAIMSLIQSDLEGIVSYEVDLALGELTVQR